MGVSDTYRLTTSMDHNGVDAHNVFWYTLEVAPADTGGEAFTLLDLFKDQVLPSLLAVQWAGLHYTGIKVENVNAIDDFAEETYGPTDYVGTASGEGLPAFVAWAFKLQRSVTVIRNGAKRFCGVTETFLDNGVANGAAIALLAVVASNIAGILTAVDAGEWQSCIVHTEKVGEEYVYTPYVCNSASYVRVSTQNSRKT